MSVVAKHEHDVTDPMGTYGLFQYPGSEWRNQGRLGSVPGLGGRGNRRMETDKCTKICRMCGGWDAGWGLVYLETGEWRRGVGLKNAKCAVGGARFGAGKGILKNLQARNNVCHNPFSWCVWVSINISLMSWFPGESQQVPAFGVILRFWVVLEGL